MTNKFKLTNDSVVLVAESPGGLYNAEQLRTVAELANSSEVAMVRALEDQRLGLVTKAENLSTISETLAEVGLSVRDYQAGLHQPVACMGSACSHSQQDALGVAIEIAAIENKYEFDRPLKIGINGCAKSCVPIHALDIGITGEKEGYRMSLGGKTALVPEFATFVAQGIPEAELPGLVDKVVATYAENRAEGETLHDVIERDGIASFAAVLAPYSQDAGAHEMELAASEDALEEFDLDELPHADDFADEGPAVDAAEEIADEVVVADDELDAAEIEEQALDEQDLEAVSLGEEHLSEEEDAEPLSSEQSLGEENELAETEELAEVELANDDLAEDELAEDEESIEAKISQSIDEEAFDAYDDDSDEDRLQAVELVEEIAGHELVDDAELAEYDADEHIAHSFAEGGSANGFAIQSVHQDGAKVVISFSTGASVAIDIDQLKSMSGHMELVFNQERVTLVEQDGTITLKSSGIEFKLPSQIAA